MNIDIATKNEVVFTSEQFGNLEQPKDKQFRYVFRRVNKFVIQTQAVRSVLVGKEIERHVDQVEYVRLCFVRFENPFQLTFDGDEKSMRDITLDDIFDPDKAELAPLASEMFNRAAKMVAEGGVEKK